MAEKINVVGRLGIRVQPDTDRFDDDLRAALKKAQKTVKATIQVAFDISEKALRDVEKRLESITASVGVDVSAKSMKQVERKLNNLQGQAAVHANVEGAAFSSGRLAYLSRPRIAPIIPKVDTAAFAAANVALNSLAALSGARVLDDVAGTLSDALRNLDRTAYTLIKTGPLITSALTGALSTVSSLTSVTVGLGNALVGLAPAALVLPGVFAGAAASITAMVSGIQKAKSELESYGPKFTAIFDVAGDKAWARSGENITRALDRVIPVLYRSMAKVGDGVGRIFAAIADAIGSNRGLRDMRATFDDIARSLAPLSRAVYHFTQAMMSITRVGASFLPRMAESFARMADSMSKWADAAARSGRMHKWIEDAVQNARELWRVVTNLGGVLSGLFTAINAGKPANTVSEVADSFERLNKAINSADVQRPLQALFGGAQQATARLMTPLANLTRSLGELAPVITTIMNLSSGAVGHVIDALARLLSDPAFQTGASDLFTGLAVGLTRIAGALAQLGPVIGPVLTLMGTLASVIGSALSTAINQFGPYLGQLATALAPLSLQLGEKLTQGLIQLPLFLQNTLIPAVRDLFETQLLPLFQVVRDTAFDLFGSLGDNAPSLAESFGNIFAGLSELAQDVLPKITPFITDLVDHFTALAEIVSGIFRDNPEMVVAFGALVMFLPKIVAGVGSLITFLGQLWPIITKIFAVVKFLGKLRPYAKFLMGFFGSLGGWMTLIVGLVMALIPYLIDAAKLLFPYLQEAFDNIAPAIGGVIEAIMPLVKILLFIGGKIVAFIGNYLLAIAPAIGEVIAGVSRVIGGFFKFLSGIFNIWVGLFEGFFTRDFSRLLKGAEQVLQGFWDVISGVFEGIFGWLGEIDKLFTGGRFGNLLQGNGFTKSQDAGVKSLFKNRSDFGKSYAEQEAEAARERSKLDRREAMANQVINIYNPTNEPASETLRRNAAQLAL